MDLKRCYRNGLNEMSRSKSPDSIENVFLCPGVIVYKRPSIKYVTLFLVNFDPPPPVTLCHTSRDPPKVRHTSRTPPIFRRPSKKSRTKVPCTNAIPIVRGGFCPGGFCPGWFLSVPPSVTIHLLQQKVKHHFKFHV